MVSSSRRTSLNSILFYSLGHFCRLVADSYLKKLCNNVRQTLKNKPVFLLFSFRAIIIIPLREDTHKKSGFFCGRTTKRGEGRTPPPRPLSKKPLSVHPILSVYIFTGSKTIFAKKHPTFLAQKFQNFFCQNPFQAIISGMDH